MRRREPNPRPAGNAHKSETDFSGRPPTCPKSPARKWLFGVKELALRLCSLYLLEEVAPDRIFLDEIWLEKPGRDATTWRWHAGVNSFRAQGDGRWWQDHLMPGGIAFSVNSVGHMVKSE
jgi:hypothetical protein